MRALFKRDLRAYFTSPLGYVFVASVILVMNINFLLGNVNDGYSDLSYVYSFMLFVLIFTTPILTMRLFSEEYKQKTDQLLLTAPVRVAHIVLGKFLAAMAVFGCVLLVSLAWPVIVALGGSLNTAGTAGNLAALLFVASAFVSIGLFMSSLTENQLISALTTLGLLLALYLLDSAAAAMQTGWLHRLGALLTKISLFRRYDLFTRGVFSLGDLVFYASVCAFFLFLTARVLEKKRWM